ncbi:gliding motility-associated C-terminal domain-containing protein [Segetibacter sp. 3557_3]|uniref:gliding motility-associated C-terminal domain-containing protein n=1 Tax=Segetibacter sp. 3557_3 TaxID=2547429 RepID=UPI00105900D6|nr:gliding motility-associated C-terminal domain-containing protein [Segetibacter sp. 3557_3]TDH23034.1 gliding motility-associated C-terminal domain-containing protein [Segetibacter sp. 3557_3]
MKYLYLCFLSCCLLFSSGLKAQTDTAFWFAAPEIANAVYAGVTLDRPIVMNLISYEKPATITISQPAVGGMPTQIYNLPANSTRSVDLTTWIDRIETRPANAIVNSGLKITSTARISAYYEVNAGSFNPDVFTLKARNALGTDFWISSQFNYGNHPAYSPLPYSSFNIIASEDNTTVTITPSNPIVGHPANTTFQVVLNKGQCYAAVATGQAGFQHLQGSHVTSNKPVAITLSDDEVYTPANGFCADIIGDQTVPVNILGTEYIALKGDLNFPDDQLYIMAVEDGTTIRKDGVTVATLSKGMTYLSSLQNFSTFISSDKPVYVYQLTGIGCELGSAILPRLKCNGSTRISFKRTSAENLYITLIVEQGGQGDFLLNGMPGIIKSSDFSVVPGSSGQWLAAKVLVSLADVPTGSIVQVNNTSHVFHLGFLQGGSSFSGTSFGYFSDFAQLTAIARSNDDTLCIGSNLLLYTDTVIGATYQWSGPNNLLINRPRVEINNALPIHSGTYILKATIPGCIEVIDSLKVQVYDKTYTTVDTSICLGQAIAGHNTSGTFVDTYVGSKGCDSIRTLNLVVRPRITTTINQSICAGSSYLGYTQAGTYTNNFTTGSGCDSSRTLILSVVDRIRRTVDTTICFGQGISGYTSSGTYIDTLRSASGCDSIRTLNLVVRPRITTTINQSICAGSSYLGYTQAGTYTNNFTTGSGCDSSRTLILSVVDRIRRTVDTTICFGQGISGYTSSGTYIDTLRSVSGCDSIRTLNLVVRPRITSTISQSICAGSSYLGYTQAGTYTNNFTTASGCDSSRTLILSVVDRIRRTIDTTICFGQGIAGYTSSGTYSDTLRSSSGCDSIRTLNLVVRPRITSTINQSICAGGSYLGYTQAGTYINNFTTGSGCDSSRTLILSVVDRIRRTIDTTICFGQGIAGYTSSGTYTDTLRSSSGCDSIRTLNLVVRPRITSTINQSICAGGSYLGYTQAGTYTNNFTTASGCDSSRTLILSVVDRIRRTVDTTICFGQGIGGYTSSGTYVDTLRSASGCDSIRTLNLVVRPRITSTITQSICAGGSYLGYTQAGTYTNNFTTASGCDSSRTLILSVVDRIRRTVDTTICFGQGVSGYTSSGTYIDTLRSASGCDSIRTLNLVVRPRITSIINQSICAGSSYLGYTQAGTYTNNFTTASGCDSSRTLILSVRQQVQTTIDTTICEGQSYAGYSTVGTYVDRFSAVGGCDSTRTLRLSVLRLPKPQLQTGQTICPGDTLMLDPGSFSGYQWQDGSAARQYLVTKPGSYSVVVSSLCGPASAAVVVSAGICGYYFPSAFTPNNDGKNDEFRIINPPQLKSYRLVIYNRWGAKIFETADYKKGWNGLYNGVQADSGTYVWFCELPDKRMLKGTITLIR